MAESTPYVAASSLPVSSRIACSTGCTSLHVPFVTERPPHYCSYSQVSLDKAYEAVVSKQMSLRRAAEEYGIPRSTLHDKVSGKVALHSKKDHKRHLTDEEELAVIEFLEGCASVGYAKSRSDVIALATQLARMRNPTAELTKGWWDSFRRRHPEVSLRQAEPISYARAVANDPAVVNKYFDLLDDVIRSNNLTQRPGQIFNCDETGLALAHKPPKVVVKSRQQHPYAITSGNKAQITVLACASASGYSIPPMIIYDRKSLSNEMIEGEVPDTFYGLSDSGWMDSTLFEEWFKNHFLRHAPAARPLLLLLDGHASHYNPSVLRMALEQQVILFCLPPYTTHLLQPLDNGVFSSLKINWRKQCQAFFNSNPRRLLNRHNFNQVFCSAWLQGMTIANVITCFKSAGIYPMNRNAVLSQICGEEAKQHGTPETAPYVPFHTTQKSQVSFIGHDDQSQTKPIILETPQIKCLEQVLAQSKEQEHSSWLATFFPKADDKVEELDPVAKLLSRPAPPSKQMAKTYLPSARVLTSEQFIQQVEEKRDKKKKAEEQKEFNKKERERKKQEREASLELKRQERMKKKEAQISEEHNKGNNTSKKGNVVTSP